MNGIEIIFWICWGLLIYSYLLYPAILWLLNFFVHKTYHLYQVVDESPSVSLLMAVHNEEKIIAEKLDSIVSSNYPKEKLEVLIGSDASTDSTNSIVQHYVNQHSFIKLIPFPNRSGKPNIINQLVSQTKHELLLLTDANVLFTNQTIQNLTKSFKDERIGLAGANILNRYKERSGIAIHEKNYIGIENKIKQWEGNVFGKMIGPFGGCYLLRKNHYQDVPPGFAVDDFFIGMNVLLQNHDAILSHQAVCYEDVSNDIEQEQRRKRRIANGNWQNVFALKKIFTKSFAASFCFFSHKILRWIGPVLMLTAFVCNFF